MCTDGLRKAITAFCEAMAEFSLAEGRVAKATAAILRELNAEGVPAAPNKEDSPAGDEKDSPPLLGRQGLA
jgi:hypothetical protein